MFSKDEIDRRISLCREVFGDLYLNNWILYGSFEEVEDIEWDSDSGKHIRTIDGVERVLYHAYMTLTCKDFILSYHFLDDKRDDVPAEDEYYMRECFSIIPKTLLGFWIVKGIR